MIVDSEVEYVVKADRQRPGFEDVVWYKIGVGRRQNAEARWILPLLCRRGHITRNEIGAIRIGQFESWFQVPTAVAPKFAEAIARTASTEDEQDAILIEEAPEGPRIQARENRREGGGGGRGGPRVHAKPFHKGAGGKGPRKSEGGKSFGGKPGGKPFGGKSDGKPFGGKSDGKPGGKPFKKGPKPTGKKFAGKRKPGGANPS